jgi:AcrR family transcriptional regulator
MARTVKPPEIRRLEIIKAARYLFQIKRYEQTTIQDVIIHLKIAKGTV